MELVIGRKKLTENPIAIINDDEYIHIVDKKKSRSMGEQEIEFDKDIELVPFPKNESQRLYVSGPTGSGKSTYCSKYIKNYLRLPCNKNNRFFIFSDVETDDILDKLKPIRVRLDEQLKDPIEPSVLKDSIILFDDIDSTPNKQVKKCVETLRDGLMTRGRHENITTLCTSHLMTNYRETRVVLNEASHITFFPRCGNSYAIDLVLKKYCGLSKEQTEKAMNLDSRWVTICKVYPMYVLYSHGVYLL